MIPKYSAFEKKNFVALLTVKRKRVTASLNAMIVKDAQYQVIRHV